jgi:hypothetical protein
VANTNYYKSHVEPYVRAELERKHGVPFSSQMLTLTTGGTHEFDAVAADHSIVASIKSLSGKTAGGKRPAAKYSTCLAELYFLSLVSAPKRILVLTTPDWHTMFTRYIEGRLVPGVEIQLLKLPTELQTEVDRVTALASGEVSFPRESISNSVNRGEAAVETKERYSPGSGCRDEVLAAAAHLQSLGQADFTPDEIVRYMSQQHSKYAVSTIQTHVVSLMCANAPKNHGTKYADLLRIAPGRYRLRV